MSFLDTRTVFLLCGVMGGFMSLVLFFIKRSYPPSIKGLGHWSGALLLLFLGGSLLALRGLLHDVFTVTLANVLFFTGLYCSYHGSQLFLGLTPRPKPWMAFIAAVAAAHVWFTFVQPSTTARILLINSCGLVVVFAHAHLISRYPRQGFPKWLTFAALASAGTSQTMRIAVALAVPVEGSILGREPINQLYATVFAFSLLLFSIGLVLLATDMLRQELVQLATRDSLTGAVTRRQWNDLCAAEFRRSLRSGRSMAVLMLDLDHFKAINDSVGHAAGDRVLINFVGMVNGLLRQDDHLGRFGGEEFILLLSEATIGQALQVAERIRQQAQAADKPACTVSIGVAVIQGGTDTVEAMLSRADAAMYRAKAAGRNRVEAG